MNDLTSSIEIAVGLIIKDKKILLSKRKPGVHLEGYWEYPGGKVESGETIEQALLRELNEELGITATQFECQQQFTYQYPEKKIGFNVFVVNEFSGSANGQEGQDIIWVDKKELVTYLLPPANEQLTLLAISLL